MTQGSIHVGSLTTHSSGLACALGGRGAGSQIIGRIPGNYARWGKVPPAIRHHVAVAARLFVFPHDDVVGVEAIGIAVPDGAVRGGKDVPCAEAENTCVVLGCTERRREAARPTRLPRLPCVVPAFIARLWIPLGGLRFRGPVIPSSVLWVLRAGVAIPTRISAISNTLHAGLGEQDNRNKTVRALADQDLCWLGCTSGRRERHRRRSSPRCPLPPSSTVIVVWKQEYSQSYFYPS